MTESPPSRISGYGTNRCTQKADRTRGNFRWSPLRATPPRASIRAGLARTRLLPGFVQSVTAAGGYPLSC
jgi:hypothetical protein